MLRYAITSGSLRSGAGEQAWGELAGECAALAQRRVDFILIREKALPAGELVTLSRSVVAEVRGTGAETKVLVAGRADVAVAAEADGVHLASGPGELRVEEVRRVFPTCLVSVSCHTLDEVKAARAQGASAVLFAPVFGKTVDGMEVLHGVGLRALQEACAAAGEVPVFALGGVTETNANDCVQVGAAGVAGIRMFFGR